MIHLYRVYNLKNQWNGTWQTKQTKNICFKKYVDELQNLLISQI